jgi:hypothetical protein
MWVMDFLATGASLAGAVITGGAIVVVYLLINGTIIPGEENKYHGEVSGLYQASGRLITGMLLLIAGYLIPIKSPSPTPGLMDTNHA